MSGSSDMIENAVRGRHRADNPIRNPDVMNQTPAASFLPGPGGLAPCLGLFLALLAPAPMAAPDQPMQGVPPSRESQATFQNYRERPFSQWTFRNAGAPMHTVMIPREGKIHQFDTGTIPGWDSAAFDRVFADNYADGVIVIRDNTVLHERYFNGFNRHAQHIWFSMTKSLVSAAFGNLLLTGEIDLENSPADVIPELAGSGFERTQVQDVLDHASAIDFKENYTDPDSEFFRYYAPALNMGWMPGAADAQPDDSDIYGVHDFLVKFIKPDTRLQPGDAFDYNSTNADLLGWLVARISGMPLDDYLQQTIWSKLGAEHDAYMVVDRAYMPVATGGMNTTLRDAAKFGMMVRDRGRFNGQQVVPAVWLEQTLKLNRRHIKNMSKNRKYRKDPWLAYHNMWWILNANLGEYAAVGIHGQVIYINQSANTVMAWFSSQPTASAANNPTFHDKLRAARELAKQLAAQSP
jgi:CubicO group peptidase (beta-lactamase class C family)